MDSQFGSVEELSEGTAFLQEKEEIAGVSYSTRRIQWKFWTAHALSLLLTFTVALVAYLQPPTDAQCARQLAPYCKLHHFPSLIRMLTT